jgi:hypothetical protein
MATYPDPPDECELCTARSEVVVSVVYGGPAGSNPEDLTLCRACYERPRPGGGGPRSIDLMRERTPGGWEWRGWFADNR